MKDVICFHVLTYFTCLCNVEKSSRSFRRRTDLRGGYRRDSRTGVSSVIFIISLPVLSWSLSYTCCVNLVRCRRLRSANQHQLIVPRCRRITFGRRAFSVAGPTVWNSLPTEFRSLSVSFGDFRRTLKTILFALYYCLALPNALLISEGRWPWTPAPSFSTDPCLWP